MTKRFKTMQQALSFILFLAPLLFTGCASSPVYAVKNAPIIATEPTPLKVKTALVQAGRELEWQMADAGKGHLVGTFVAEERKAVVDIYYNRRTYSILYRDSDNLEFNGSTIQRDYNRWVQKLEEAIQKALAEL